MHPIRATTRTLLVDGGNVLRHVGALDHVLFQHVLALRRGRVELFPGAEPFLALWKAHAQRRGRGEGARARRGEKR